MSSTNAYESTRALSITGGGGSRFMLDLERADRFYHLNLIDLGCVAHSFPSCRVAFWSADGSHLPALSPSAEEPIGAVGLEPGNTYSGRHLERLQKFSRLRIESPQITFVTFPGAVPELSVYPGYSGDEPLGLDRAKNRTCIGIDLMDLPIPILTNPERAYTPRDPRHTTHARS